MLFTCVFLACLNYAELGCLQLNACKEVSATPVAFKAQELLTALRNEFVGAPWRWMVQRLESLKYTIQPGAELSLGKVGGFCGGKLLDAVHQRRLCLVNCSLQPLLRGHTGEFPLTFRGYCAKCNL